MRHSICVRSLLILFAMLVSAMSLVTPARAEDTRTYVKIAKNENEAPLDERYFDDPQEAWDFAASQSSGNAYLYLGSDWLVVKQNTLESDAHPCVFMDLKGHTVKRELGGSQVRNGGFFVVEKDAQLTIRDSRPNSSGYRGIPGGVITGGANTNGGGAFTVRDGGKLEIQGGTIYRCTTNEHGGAAYVEGKNSFFAMSGGRIYFCQTIGAWGRCHGGAVYCDKANAAFSNCAIDSCYSEDYGGALYMKEGQATFDRVSIIGNHCVDYGGAIYMDHGWLKMYNCRVAGNEAKDHGGAIYNYGSYEMRLNGCVLYKNKSYGKGGALYVGNFGTQLINTDVIANSAQGYGGGVYVESRYDVGLKGLMHIENNSGKNNRNNLTLADGVTSNAYSMNGAYFTNGGLYEGSHIGLSSTSRRALYTKEISDTQMGYFFSDSGYFTYRDTSQRESPFVSSVFGEGAAAGVALGLGIAAMAGTVVYLLLSNHDKRKRAKEGQR